MKNKRGSKRLKVRNKHLVRVLQRGGIQLT